MAGWDEDFPVPPPEPMPGAAAGGRRIRFAEPDRVELTLLHPLDIEGERLDALTIRRVTAGEMLALVEGPDAPADDAALTRAVVAAMAGIGLDVLDALSPDDAGRVAEAALPFMPGGLVAALERATQAARTESPAGPA